MHRVTIDGKHKPTKWQARASAWSSVTNIVTHSTLWCRPSTVLPLLMHFGWILHDKGIRNFYFNVVVSQIEKVTDSERCIVSLLMANITRQSDKHEQAPDPRSPTLSLTQSSDVHSSPLTYLTQQKWIPTFWMPILDILDFQLPELMKRMRTVPSSFFYCLA